MTDPVPASARSPGILPVILRIVLAAVLLAIGLAGLATMLLLAVEWAIKGFHYDEYDRSLIPLLLFIAQFCFMFSAFFLGIVLRFARWQRAPTASLVLAITSAVAIVIGNSMMTDALSAPKASDAPGMIMLTGIGILIVSMPPFLHWRRARKGSRNP